MRIDVSNHQKKIRISKKWVEGVAGRVLKKTGIRGDLSIALVDNNHIRKLNRKYRHKDKSTNVLSFPMQKSRPRRLSPRRLARGQATFSKKMNSSFFKIPFLLGDVVISVERAKSDARKYGCSFREEMARLIKHGILHLLGYTHKQMGRYK